MMLCFVGPSRNVVSNSKFGDGFTRTNFGMLSRRTCSRVARTYAEFKSFLDTLRLAPLNDIPTLTSRASLRFTTKPIRDRRPLNDPFQPKPRPRLRLSPLDVEGLESDSTTDFFPGFN